MLTLEDAYRFKLRRTAWFDNLAMWRELDKDLDKENAFMRPFLNLRDDEAVDPDKLARIIADYGNIELDCLYNGSRNPEHKNARYIFFYLLREECKMTFPQMAHYLARDNSTVQYGYREGKYLVDNFEAARRVTHDIINAARRTDNGRDGGATGTVHRLVARVADEL